ncbi:hypothetical protein, partial [Thiolapillus sp.]|uniref:hypothetical protein n=1 Tax=Thiolapillus sp. TaxID=2017437 RepID=UPI003AF9996C
MKQCKQQQGLQYCADFLSHCFISRTDWQAVEKRFFGPPVRVRKRHSHFSVSVVEKAMGGLFPHPVRVEMIPG